jgi:lysozyme
MNLRPVLIVSGLGLIAWGMMNDGLLGELTLPVPGGLIGGNANTTSAAGRAAIKKHEGFRTRAYRDGSHYSIGYGHLITGTDGLNSSSVISLSRGEQLFSDDLADAERAINSAIMVPMTQGQFDALADFVYNRGAGNFARSGIAAAMNSGDIAQAQSLLANFDNGTVLASRREQNAAQFSA